MAQRFRIALIFNRRTGDEWRIYFLTSHRFAHTKPDWLILQSGGYSVHDWHRGLSFKPDGVLATLEPEELPLPPIPPETRVVIVNNAVANHAFRRVAMDSTAAGHRATAHLISRNLAHYAYVGWSSIGYSQECLSGFRAAIHDAGLGASARSFDLDSAQGSLFVPPDAWFAELPKPCGIICANDGLAVRLVNAIQRAGFAVPEDIAVIGIGDDEVLCVQSPISLSSIAMDRATQTWAAANYLDRWLRTGQPGEPAILYPPGEVVERQSTLVFGELDPFVRRALTLIHMPRLEPMTVESLLDQMGNISRRRLELLFRRRLGRTPYQEIMRVRVELTKKLLRSTSLSIDEIAFQAGFSSSNHVSRPFKALMGITPTQYRNEFASVRRRAERGLGVTR